MLGYKKFMDQVDKKAYHEGEFRWQEGEYTVTRTYNWTPPGCHDSCGVLYYVKDNKLEKVEGDPLAPYNNGELCMRCLNMMENVNDPGRVKYPLRRAGERGENKWERISWDEAMAEIKEKVNKIWQEYGSQAIIAIHGTGRNVNWQLPLIGYTGLRTPNVTMLDFSGYACYSPRTIGAIAPLGDFVISDASQQFEDRYANPDWRPPEVLVVWGDEPIASNGDGFLGHWLTNCVQLGTKIIDIDPRLTWWAARAEYFLQIRPGTDAALAMAFLERDHHRGALRQGIRGLLVLGLRRACRAGEGFDSGMGRGNLLVGRRGHPWCRKALCERQQFRHSMGPCHGPAALCHAAEPCRFGPHGHYGEHRRPGRQYDLP